MARSFIQNLVGFSTKSDLAKLGNGFTQNMYVETTDATEHAVSRVLRPFPGYSSVASAEGAPRGLFRVSRGYDGLPKVYGVWGNTLYLFKDDNTLFAVGIVSVGTNKCQFAETGGEGDAHPHLVVVDGQFCFAVDTTLSPTLQAADFRKLMLPVRAGDSTGSILVQPSHVAYAYGYLVINDYNTDALYFSYQYPFEQLNKSGTGIEYDIFRCTENSAFYISKGGWVEYAEWQPDNTIAMVGNGSRIFTFGARSYQIFAYNSSGNTPFTSPDTAANMVGIKNADSLAVFGNRCVWLGAAEQGEGQVYSLTSDNVLERISTPEIERRIDKCDFRACRSFIFQYGHHVFYVLSFPADAVTIAYDFAEQGWVDLQSLTPQGKAEAFRYENTAMDHNGNTVLQYNGGLVKVDSSKWSEHDGRHIVRKRAGGMVQVNHRPFFVDAVKLLTNNGEYGTLAGSDCRVMLRYSVDGASYEDMETYSMGAVGQYGFDTEFYNLGLAKYLTIEVGCSEDVPFAIYGMTASVRECK